MIVSMSKPMLLVVDDREHERGVVAGALDERYGTDYRVVPVPTAAEAVGVLRQEAAVSGTVAVVFAWEGLGDGDPVDLLVSANALHPGVKRVLVIGRGQWGSAHPAVEAMTLGRIDHYLFQPFMADERWFHLPVTQVLAGWSQTQPSPYHAVEVVGDEWAAESHDLRTLLARIGIPFAFHPVQSDEGRRLLDRAGLDGVRLPVLAFQSGTVLSGPSVTEIAAALGFTTSPADTLCDVAIVGAGPAGLAAAVYAASEGLRTTLIESGLPGGQASTSSLIRNYLGFQHGLTGDEFANRAVEQAWLFGAEFVVGQAATGLEVEGSERRVQLDGGGCVRASTVVLACGVAWRRLGVTELEVMRGVGVFYGAAGGETKAVEGTDVFVVGGGNSAGQAAVHLARYARSVTILVRGASLAASMSDYLIQEIEAHPRISVRRRTEVVGGGGRGRLEFVMLRDLETGGVVEVPAAAVFVMIGAAPHTTWLPPEIDRDAGGYVKTGYDLIDGRTAPAQWPLERLPHLLETSVPGVYAAGDVRHRSVKRVAAAAGEGATAIQLVHGYLGELAR